MAIVEYVTAFFHTGHAWLWKRFYAAQVAAAYGTLRWVEYAISASTMLVLLAIFAGHVNAYVLALLGALVFTTMKFGWLSEVVARPDATHDEWSSPRALRVGVHLLGYVPLLVAWVVVCVQFVRYASVEGRDASGVVANKMPEWVYALFVVEILLFWSFAFVQLRVLLGRPSDYLRAEYRYVALSFVAKSSLAFLVFGGTLDLALDNRP